MSPRFLKVLHVHSEQMLFEKFPIHVCERLHLFGCVQGSNYKEGLTPVLSLLTEGSRCHREIRRYIKAQVS